MQLKILIFGLKLLQEILPKSFRPHYSITLKKKNHLIKSNQKVGRGTKVVTDRMTKVGSMLTNQHSIINKFVTTIKK